ncbi:hypothetical protein NDU88_003671 [Pleurodeles waltl]|uniref:Uncharacterized protein n=1 Tax=Pleurodeles waltl TaxID=8319 RepID=A0AAV7RDK4_PLEWA|nr:hypothetical protein NDU88_003671 [Pleurodeles waltl]
MCSLRCAENGMQQRGGRRSDNRSGGLTSGEKETPQLGVASQEKLAVSQVERVLRHLKGDAGVREVKISQGLAPPSLHGVVSIAAASIRKAGKYQN